MPQFNEYSNLVQIAVLNPKHAFVSQEKLAKEWRPLRFHSMPDFEDANAEFALFRQFIATSGAEVVDLPAHENLTIDSIYPRDNVLVSPK